MKPCSQDANMPQREGAAGACEEELCERLCAAATRCALHAGMSRDQAEDSAQGFVVHALINRHRVLRVGTYGREADAWILRCADNWVKNSGRRLRREHHHAIPWPEWTDEALECVPADIPSPEFSTLHQELKERLAAAVAWLPVSQREIYICFFEQHQSIQQLATASRRTPNAVRQALWVLRRRLRAILTEQGFDEEEAMEYLSDLATARAGGSQLRATPWP